MSSERVTRIGLRTVALGYLFALLFVPVGIVLYKTFEPGLGNVWASITTPAAIHAFWLTIMVTAIAVPLNTALGILAALVLVRGRIRGKPLLDALIDLPFAVSPIVVGLSLVLVYGANGWFGGALTNAGIQVIFSWPGIVLATIFVTLPFVVRSVQPVLIELDRDMEEAAASLGAGGWTTFRRIVLPNLGPAIISGCALAFARAVGEFGSIVLISGNIPFQTQVASVFVFKQIESDAPITAAAVSVVLLVLSLGVLLAIRGVGSWGSRHEL